MILPEYASGKIDVEANVDALPVFSGIGGISHITIWKDVDGGTVQLHDTKGNAIIPAAITDYGGSFLIKLFVAQGCTITTTGFTGGRLSIFFVQ